MPALGMLWQWYSTVNTAGIATPRQDTALFAIASVAAVVWTGGLVAYQLKGPSIGRIIALDMVQLSFLGAIFGLFLQPLTFRYTATVFWCLYIAGSIVILHQNRNIDFVSKDRAKFPALTDDFYQEQARQNIRYAIVTVASSALLVWMIIYPYPTVIAWSSTIAVFLGLQMVLWVLGNTSDDWRRDAAITNQQAIMRQLAAIMEELKVIITQLNALIERIKGPSARA